MSEQTSAAASWTPPPSGSPCWIEIPADDVQACKKFYSAVFPAWEFKPARGEYTDEKIAMWSFAGPSGLSGGITKVAPEHSSREQEKGSGFIVYHFVKSIDATKEVIEKAGGTSITGKEKEGPNGMHMQFKDVAGNIFAIYQLVD